MAKYSIKGYSKSKTRGRDTEQGRRNPVISLGKCLLAAWVLSIGLLLLLALLLYALDLSVKMVSLGVILIYIVSSLLAGFLGGKRMGSRKFLWGLIMGSLYFVLLALISVVVNQSAGSVADNFLKVYIICAGSGMLGGMLG